MYLVGVPFGWDVDAAPELTYNPEDQKWYSPAYDLSGTVEFKLLVARNWDLSFGTCEGHPEGTICKGNNPGNVSVELESGSYKLVVHDAADDLTWEFVKQ